MNGNQVNARGSVNNDFSTCGTNVRLEGSDHRGEGEGPFRHPQDRPVAVFDVFKTKYALGVALIVLVACIWVGASEWIQRIFGDLNFNKPYFLTYFNTTGFSLWNLGYFFSSRWRSVPHGGACGDAPYGLERSDAGATCNESGESAGPPMGNGADAAGQLSDSTERSSAVADGPHLAPTADTDEARPYTIREIWRCAAYFCPLWFAANALFNYSLSLTSVASNTILSNTSSVWTLLFSWLLLGHPMWRWHKIIAIVLCLGGGAMVALSDRDAGESAARAELLGDVLALLAAVFYGAYTTVLRFFLPDEERYSMGMLFGAIGLINALVLWPGLLLLHFVGVERFQLPSGTVLLSLLLNALIGTNLSDVLWAKSVVLTSPLVATLGLSLTVPIAMVTDALLWGAHYPLVYISGAFTVLAGFIVANLKDAAI